MSKESYMVCGYRGYRDMRNGLDVLMSLKMGMDDGGDTAIFRKIEADVKKDAVKGTISSKKVRDIASKYVRIIHPDTLQVWDSKAGRWKADPENKVMFPQAARRK